jgi:hypothetical protein
MEYFSRKNTPGVQLDARELFLSLDENTVFFKNAQDNALYYLPL